MSRTLRRGPIQCVQFRNGEERKADQEKRCNCDFAHVEPRTFRGSDPDATRTPVARPTIRLIVGPINSNINTIGISSRVSGMKLGYW